MTRSWAGHHLFEIGQSVQLADHLRAGEVVPRGTVVGFAEGEIIEGDVVVRWESGLEAALAPRSLTPVQPA